jgi:hypothetical protein
MNNHAELQPIPTPVPAGTGTTAAPSPRVAKKSNRNVLIIAGVLLVLTCLCVGIAGTGIGVSMRELLTERPKVESVIDDYLNAMADQDARRAYALMSTRAKRYVPLADIEIGLQGNNYVVFEGYRSLEVIDFTITLSSDPDPDMPQGVVAEVQGMISYTDSFTGDFYAILEKEGDEWRIHGINVNVPPDKFGP